MHKNKLIASLLLALATCFAQADPLQFVFEPTAVNTNNGVKNPLATFSFTVTGKAGYSGILATSTTSAAADEFSQLSLLLTGNGLSPITIPGSALVLASSGTELVDGEFGPYTVYTNTYTFDPYVLDAGTWTAALWGKDIDGAKSADTVALTLNDPPTNVPEPQSLALAAIALAALGAASRRRSSIR